MNRMLAGSLKVLHPFQEEIAHAYMREKRVSPAAARASITPQFEERIVECYTKAVDKELKIRGGDVIGMVEKLAKDKSTRSRWKRRLTKPQWNTYCLAFAAFDTDLGPRLPRGRSVVIQAIAETLPMAASLWSKRKVRATITPDEVIVLHHASGSLLWRSASTASGNDKERKLTRAADSILERAAREGVTWSDPHYSTIAKIMKRWTAAWCLFHAKIAYEWKYWK